jgi:WD40 repeat protein
MSNDISTCNVLKLLQEVQGQSSETTILLSDAGRAVLQFFTPLIECATQIYFSVLPLMPTETLLRKTYSHESSSSVRIVGMGAHWNPCVRVINVEESLESVAVSFDGTQIASVSSAGQIIIFNMDTGELKARLQKPPGWESGWNKLPSVAWTPNGYLVSGLGTVVIWDTDTWMPE